MGDFPPSLQDQTSIASQVVTWIRVRLPLPADAQAPTNAVASFNWLGINATKVSQQIQVPVEIVGTATGEPDQSYTLINTPVITSTVQITVNGVAWTQTDDLLAAPSEIEDATGAQVYTRGQRIRDTSPLAPACKARGPRRERPIIASYYYGGGVAGNVGIGAINASTQLPAGFQVSNPAAYHRTERPARASRMPSSAFP